MAKDSTFSGKHQVNYRGKWLDLSTPAVMGILNLTPDSFHIESRSESLQKTIERAGQMLTDGAQIIDLGAQSTRPNSQRIDPQEELDRIQNAIEELSKHYPSAILSIDTYYASVAKFAIQKGAHLVNDVTSGKLDPEMLPYILQSKTPYIAGHFAGEIGKVPTHSLYKDTTDEVFSDLQKLTERFQATEHPSLLVDLGLGFGKTLEDNYELLGNLEKFKALKHPIVIGLSRKSMIWKVLGNHADQALNGTSALHAVALLKGANILRVHDVKEAVEVVKLVSHLK